MPRGPKSVVFAGIMVAWVLWTIEANGGWSLTLSDLIKLMRRFWLLCVGLPVFAVVAVLVLLSFRPVTYQATSVLNVSKNDVAILEMAKALAPEYSLEHGLTVAARAGASSKVIQITATGSNPDECVAAANKMASQVQRQCAKIYDGTDIILTASAQADNTSPKKPKYALAAAGGGLFVAICLCVLYGRFRRPILSPENIRTITATPVLGCLPELDGESGLFSNVRLAVGNDKPEILWVVPVGKEADAGGVAAALSGGFGKHDSRLVRPWGCVQSGSISEACRAERLPFIVVVVRQWKDTLTDLQELLSQLDLAGVKPMGIVIDSR